MPAVHPAVAFVLSAMAGHLFGYEAALAIDAQARPLREARAAIEAVVVDQASADGDGSSSGCARALAAGDRAVLRRSALPGQYDGHLEASTAVRLVIAVALRHRAAAARGLRGRVGQGRHADGASSTTWSPR